MKSLCQAGFSLLELLVALFVVVIMTSLVTLALNSGGQDMALEARARSLADSSGFALDEAQMRGVDMGLLIEHFREGDGSSYSISWLERMPQGWRRPTVDRDIFSPRVFPGDIELELEIEGVPVELLTRLDGLPAGGGKTTETVPQVIFYSSGEVTMGSIVLRQVETGEPLWRIEWDLLGRFTLLQQGDTRDE